MLRAWLISISCLLAVPAAAAPPDSPLTQFRDGSLHLRLGGFGSQPRVERAGEEVELGFFGGGYEEIFAGSPDALLHMEDYAMFRKVGFGLWATGLAVLVAELVMFAVDSDTFRGDDGGLNALYWSMLGGGALVGITGGAMLQGANGCLSDAIGDYNRDLYDRLSVRSSTGPALRLGWRTSF